MSLERLTSDRLRPAAHGFFTRKGGASSGLYSGLNCGLGSKDQTECVMINRARVAEAMDVEAGALVGVHQYHSDQVVVVTDPSQDRPKADAMVTNVPGIALGILTADCQPVLFADRVAGVIGAAHAGWGGALTGVLGNTVDAMVALGAQADRITAVIGPCISQSAYEVGPEFFDAFVQQDPSYEKFFIPGQNNRHHFDLPGFGLHKLKAAGVEDAEWIGECTYADPERFFSYRRATHAKEADYGRLISVIRL